MFEFDKKGNYILNLKFSIAMIDYLIKNVINDSNYS